MSKDELSVRQMDERTDYYKSKIENLSQTMSEHSVPHTHTALDNVMEGSKIGKNRQ